MNAEVEKYHLLIRLAAYSGHSLRFALVGMVDDEIVLSTQTALHHLPPNRTLSETAEHIMNVMRQHVSSLYVIPENIQWIEVVSPGVCLN